MFRTPVSRWLRLHTNAVRRGIRRGGAAVFEQDRMKASKTTGNSDRPRFDLIKMADRMSKVAVTTLIVAAIFVCGLMVYSDYAKNAPEDYLKRAESHIEDVRYDKAFTEYQKCLEKYPENEGALLGLLGIAINTEDRHGAKEYCEALLSSGTLERSNADEFMRLSLLLCDNELNVSLYQEWLRLHPNDTKASLALVEAYAGNRNPDQALEVVTALSEHGHSAVAAIAAGKIVGLAHEYTAPQQMIRYCELWVTLDNRSKASTLALADIYRAAGMTEDAVSAYQSLLAADRKTFEAYDGLLNIYYQDNQLKERLATLESAVRNIGSQKYRDMLDSTRINLDEYYSTIKIGPQTYRDGIYKITITDMYGNVLESLDGSGFSADEVSYTLEFYDTQGNVKTMELDNEQMKATVEDIDYDGVREVLVKRYILSGLDLPEEVIDSVFWYDVYRIDRNLNRLIFATDAYPKYFGTVFAPALRSKALQFERLRDGIDNEHYGATYGFLRALHALATDFSAGEWAPESSGSLLRERMQGLLIVPSLEDYIRFKSTAFGMLSGDFSTASGFYPGMPEAEVDNRLGKPLHTTEQLFEGQAPDGTVREYTNRILEYTGVNFYTSDGVVKALRINTQTQEGPRLLRIGDTLYDIINKFPAVNFDGIANYPSQKANADIEFFDRENGIILGYTVKNGIIMDIELYYNDDTGNWKPGTNVATVTEGSTGSTGSAGTSGAGGTSGTGTGGSTGDAGSDANEDPGGDGAGTGTSDDGAGMGGADTAGGIDGTGTNAGTSASGAGADGTGTAGGASSAGTNASDTITGAEAGTGTGDDGTEADDAEGDDEIYYDGTVDGAETDIGTASNSAESDRETSNDDDSENEEIDDEGIDDEPFDDEPFDDKPEI